MKQYIEIRCRHCGAGDPVKNGRSGNGAQRCRCSGCGRSFQHEYRYNAWKPGVKEQIEKQTLNSSGIGDIGGNLCIAPNTAVSGLKKTPAEVNPCFGPRPDGIETEIKTDAEADEFRSYIGRKKCQRWTWYAVERKSGVIPARHNGRRTDESCSLLMDKLSVFPVMRYYTDDRRSYRKYIPPSKHIVRKSRYLENREKKSQFQNTH